MDTRVGHMETRMTSLENTNALVYQRGRNIIEVPPAYPPPSSQDQALSFYGLTVAPNPVKPEGEQQSDQ
ncbi:hypothetical protein E2562_003931 [Oryza meyeriana var. granulata]|uniref:Uncharacterized protein n=1 Tax=Oryza meyeriana var. granulata TaxID=110450 RepID=A0A6G1CXI8_9ORYZ|nr:hypothetical protein E2562_003931 [Oryza meyeriana var. granulata]